MYLRFVCAWIVIISVASYDAYLTAKHEHVMKDVELNPVGRMVLSREAGVPVLIGLKTEGLALALLFCFGLWQNHAIRRRVLFASYTVAVLAVGMFGVMNDDSDRARRVQEYRHGLKAVRSNPELSIERQRLGDGVQKTWTDDLVLKS